MGQVTEKEEAVKVVKSVNQDVFLLIYSTHAIRLRSPDEPRSRGQLPIGHNHV